MTEIDALVAPDVRAYLAALAVLAAGFALALPWALEFTSRRSAPRDPLRLDEREAESIRRRL